MKYNSDVSNWKTKASFIHFWAKVGNLAKYWQMLRVMSQRGAEQSCLCGPWWSVCLIGTVGRVLAVNVQLRTQGLGTKGVVSGIVMFKHACRPPIYLYARCHKGITQLAADQMMLLMVVSLFQHLHTHTGKQRVTNNVKANEEFVMQ